MVVLVRHILVRHRLRVQRLPLEAVPVHHLILEIPAQLRLFANRLLRR